MSFVGFTIKLRKRMIYLHISHLDLLKYFVVGFGWEHVLKSLANNQVPELKKRLLSNCTECPPDLGVPEVNGRPFTSGIHNTPHVIYPSFHS